MDPWLDMLDDTGSKKGPPCHCLLLSNDLSPSSCCVTQKLSRLPFRYNAQNRPWVRTRGKNRHRSAFLCGALERQLNPSVKLHHLILNLSKPDRRRELPKVFRHLD